MKKIRPVSFCVCLRFGLVLLVVESWACRRTWLRRHRCHGRHLSPTTGEASVVVSEERVLVLQAVLLDVGVYLAPSVGLMVPRTSLRRHQYLPQPFWFPKRLEGIDS